MLTAWILTGTLAACLIILTLIDIHDIKKRYNEDIEKRNRIIEAQRLKEMERLKRNVNKEIADDGYFLVKDHTDVENCTEKM